LRYQTAEQSASASPLIRTRPVQSGQATYALQVDDIERAFVQAVALGAKMVAAPGAQFWGYGAVVADPDGHLLHL
jgi:uncharacterized glyoxalase superfamily protein PhnB